MCLVVFLWPGVKSHIDEAWSLRCSLLHQAAVLRHGSLCCNHFPFNLLVCTRDAKNGVGPELEGV